MFFFALYRCFWSGVRPSCCLFWREYVSRVMPLGGVIISGVIFLGRGWFGVDAAEVMPFYEIMSFFSMAPNP